MSDNPVSKAAKSFRYSQLPKGSFFRYLVLRPGTQENPIECDLVVARLEDTVTRFEAISYVWGSNTRDHEIVCEGNVLEITANLYEVLSRCRLPHESRNLWADSICINQDDLAEKAQQVAAMGRIYSAAARVLVHIGGDDDGHAVAAKSIVEDVAAMVESVLAKLGTPIPWDSFPGCRMNDPITSDSRWHAMSVLLRQPWFKRGWVVQEVALSRETTIHWHHTELSWHKFMSTAFWLAYKAPLQITIRYRLSVVGPHLEHYHTRHAHVARAFRPEPTTCGYSLIDCFNESRNLEVSNPRDKIYATMHLPYLESESRYIKHVDYVSSAVEVFKNFALEHVLQTKTVSILDYVTHTSQSLQPKKYSWVPQWHTVSGANWPLAVSRYTEQPLLCSRTECYQEPIFIRDDILRVRGVIFDTVHYASEAVHQGTLQMARDFMISMLQHIWTKIESSTVRCAYEPAWRLEIFLRVVVQNRFGSNAIDWYNSAAAVYLHLAKYSLEPNMFKTPPWLSRAVPSDTELYCMRATGTLFKRKVVMTRRGYIGLAPLETQEGDVCGIVFGCKLPCILRKQT